MLQKQTVSYGTLELLNALMLDEQLTDFFLVGGTALSLQIGHRISIDIDLFSVNGFDENQLLSYLESTYKFRLDYQSKNTLKGQIGDVKVDFITHGYPLISPMLIDEGVRMANSKDIAAMKLNAIATNGTRIKDYIDIAYLSTSLSLMQMTEAYAKKYATRNPLMVIKSLRYYNDIDFNEPIEMISKAYSWKIVTNRLERMIESPEEVFDSL